MTALTLRELNSAIKETLQNEWPAPVWVTAEIFELHSNRGHCYLDLVEKSQSDHRIVARQRAMIWAGAAQRLLAAFRLTTGRELQAGMEVLLQVEVTFHEVYGMSLSVSDLDPTYTLGSMERLKQEVMERLQREGVWDINRSLEVPEVIQRVAVVASATSAGYGDFMDQLLGGHPAIHFMVTLFPAVMQGDGAAASVVAALDAVNASAGDFDVVVIIRGGGSQADLQCFNTYEIAASVAQFPLPVLTGIGHDRDTSVTDMVAAVPLKTPTAVAEYVAEGAARLAEYLEEVPGRMRDGLSRRFADERRRIEAGCVAVLPAASARLHAAFRQLDARTFRARQAVTGRLAGEGNRLQQQEKRLMQAPRTALERARQRLMMAGTQWRLLHPDRVLQRGYAMVHRGGRVLSRAAQAAPSDVLQVEMADGVLQVQVNDIQQKNI